jgi:hypothetical protein
MPLGDLLSCLPFMYLSFHLFRRAPSFRRIKHSEQQQQQKRGGGRSQPRISNEHSRENPWAAPDGTRDASQTRSIWKSNL